MTKNQLIKFKKQIINLYKSPPLVRRHILRHSSPEFLKVLSECALNILKNNIVLSKREKAKLVRHKSIIRKLASKKINTKTRNRILLHKGGFLLNFLRPIVKVFGQLF